MFTDPITITVNSVANPLPRVESNGKKAIYSSADGTLALTISHSQPQANRVRTMVRLDKKAVVPDPLTSVNDYENLGIYIVVDRPFIGFSDATIDQHIQALKAFLTTGNNTKLYGQES